jgi:hypothetical protein
MMEARMPRMVMVMRISTRVKALEFPGLTFSDFREEGDGKLKGLEIFILINYM